MVQDAFTIKNQDSDETTVRTYLPIFTTSSSVVLLEAWADMMML